jgi:hypothetical protein
MQRLAQKFWRREDKAWRQAAPPGATTNSSEVLDLRWSLSSARVLATRWRVAAAALLSRAD